MNCHYPLFCHKLTDVVVVAKDGHYDRRGDHMAGIFSVEPRGVRYATVDCNLRGGGCLNRTLGLSPDFTNRLVIGLVRVTQLQPSGRSINFFAALRNIRLTDGCV
ncbi:hypothetical protein TNCV_1989321 [Trichonephila clavipes]|nr:hypothetical protein TNCV_1989321 [Trichonephila clavipes]